MLRNFKKVLSTIISVTVLFTGTISFSTVNAFQAQPKITLEIGTINAYPGEDIVIPVSVSDNSGFAGLKFNLAYDQDTLTITKCKKDSDFGDFNFMSNVKVVDKDYLSLVLYSADGSNLEDDGQIATLSVTVSPDAQEGTVSNITIIPYSIDVTDTNYTILKSTLINGTVNIIEKPEETTTEATTTTEPTTTTVTTTEATTTTEPTTTTVTTTEATTTTEPTTTTVTTTEATTTTEPTTTTVTTTEATTTTEPTTTTTEVTTTTQVTFAPPVEDVLHHVGKNVSHEDMKFCFDVVNKREDVSRWQKKALDFNKDNKTNVFDCIFIKMQKIRNGKNK